MDSLFLLASGFAACMIVGLPIIYALLKASMEAQYADIVRKTSDEVAKDAVRRSSAAIKGQIGERFAPFSDGFGYEPADARFLGSPVDYVVFDGMTDGEIKGVAFVEVKVGALPLSPFQRQVSEAIRDGRVAWRVLQLPDRD
ncbi:MAG: Holliday junction resolvase [Chloroflexi bacterium]|nr:Holliday junction resolvase [Chloroflexota bacterium]